VKTVSDSDGSRWIAVFSTKKGMKHVWKGQAADSEIRNISARQDAFSRWTATDNRSKRKVAVRQKSHSFYVDR